MSSYVLRPPTTDDVPRLAEIHVAGWRAAYRGIVPDHELYVDRTVAKAMAFWTTVLAQGTSQILVYDDGIVKGFCLHMTCRDADVPGAHEVGALYVEPAFWRSGVGSPLLAGAEVGARMADQGEVKLWVLEDNAPGRAFYERNGYRFDGTTKAIPEWNGAVELRYTKAMGPIGLSRR